MVQRVDFFDSTYSHFTDPVLDAIRKETFGTDIGQNSWLTADEYDRLLAVAQPRRRRARARSRQRFRRPGPVPRRTTGCRVTGIDANETEWPRPAAGGAPAKPSALIQRADANAPPALRRRHFRRVPVHRLDEPLSRSARRAPGMAPRASPGRRALSPIRWSSPAR